MKDHRINIRVSEFDKLLLDILKRNDTASSYLRSIMYAQIESDGIDVYDLAADYHRKFSFDRNISNSEKIDFLTNRISGL